MSPNFSNPVTLSPCIFWIMEGLRKGLTQFAGPTRVALVLGSKHLQEPQVIDEQALLCGLDNNLLTQHLGHWDSDWPTEQLAEAGMVHVRQAFDDGAAENQDWFVRTSARVVPQEIIEQWLEQAARFLHAALASQELLTPAMPSCVAIENFAVHIIGSYLDKLSAYQSDQFRYARVTRALQNSAKLSQTIEEGNRPTGVLAFLDL